MQAALPNLIEGFRQLFGVRITDADLKILLDKLPDIGKSAETNKAIMGVLKKYGERAKQKHRIAREVTKEDGGFRKHNYEERVEQKWTDYNIQENIKDSVASAPKLDEGRVYVLDNAFNIKGSIPADKIEEHMQNNPDHYIQ